MKFYSSISKNYDYVFPLNTNHLSFIKKFTDNSEEDTTVLDIGCGTGSLSFEMAKCDWSVFSIDFDEEMISMAKEKKGNGGAYPVFKHMDMRLINEHYQPESFNSVVCFGNTLVHLLSVDDIKRFLEASYEILIKGGHLLIQILNYEHILNNKIDKLPQIENDHIKFERYYEYNHPYFIDFKTILTVKSNNEVVHNSIQLLPIKRNLMEQLLKEAGFDNIEFYGNFKANPLTENNMPLVLKAVK